MLNRLMFIYFIQKRRFLDGDVDYLRNRLARVRLLRGKDKFHSFYRQFLLRLFHEGLGKPPHERESDLEELLGEVPYLNGGLFDQHELERANPDLEIPDRAFERIFAFFEDFDWTLEPRPASYYAEHPGAREEINPDILGYIFEKYINQKEMGAYYTKEDITDYIAKNTIVPFLLDAARKDCAVAFEAYRPLWRLLEETPDDYLYPAMRQGIIDDAGQVIALPDEIAAGLDDVARRGGWNRAADAPYALPTETWREHVARRRRYLELREKLAAGEVHEVNDLVTYNLDIRRFALDAIENCEGPEFLRAFYHALERVSVLDPTCGSGAFLFAALNVLEPLYEACLGRMAEFVEDADASGVKRRKEAVADFRQTLDRVAAHPSRKYFIHKSIVVNNLCGVDLMEEAVEICKLRLFLKLVAQVESVRHLKPLPDIDFNIRAGNTLVGFTSLDEIRQSQAGKLAFSSAEIAKIEVQAAAVDKQFQDFRSLQTTRVDCAQASAEIAAAKSALRSIQSSLTQQLDVYLAGEYGIDAALDKNAAAFKKWRQTHAPFHWFVDFFGVMRRGGFDVILGNPPWREYAAVRRDYTVRGYATVNCGNLHGIYTERGIRLRSPRGMLSFIVQLPLASSSRMAPVRDVLRGSSEALHALMFDDRPGKLFDGLQNCRSVVFLSRARDNGKDCQVNVTRYQRWATSVREHLFQTARFTAVCGSQLYTGQFAKYPSTLADSCFHKMAGMGGDKIECLLSDAPTKHFIFYQEATRYWIKATVGYPYYAKDREVGPPAHGRHLYLRSGEAAHAVCAALNSSLFYLYFIAFGDCFHLSHTLACGFPFAASLADDATLVQLNKRLMADLKKNAERKTIRTRDGHQIAYDEFYVSRSKPIIDDIDAVLARHYGFSPEELDAVVNFDAKFRMGQDNEGDSSS